MDVTFRLPDIGQKLGLDTIIATAPSFPSEGVPLKFGGRVVGRAYPNGTARITDNETAVFLANSLPHITLEETDHDHA